MSAPSPPSAKTRWLKLQLDFVRSHLPPAPARVIDLGCGKFGGLVPALREAGYEALGVDPEAPAGEAYRQVEFEQFTQPWTADAIIASTSLHHTADLPTALDRVTAALRPSGVLIVVEWDWQSFDERSARWCFDRLGPADEDEKGWLHHHRERWQESGRSWADHLAAWATEENLHAGDALVAALKQRFDATLLSYGPYFASDLDGISPEAERAAIDAGEIQASGIQFVGTRPPAE